MRTTVAPVQPEHWIKMHNITESIVQNIQYKTVRNPEQKTFMGLVFVNQKQRSHCNLIPKQMSLRSLMFIVNQKTYSATCLDWLSNE